MTESEVVNLNKWAFLLWICYLISVRNAEIFTKLRWDPGIFLVIYQISNLWEIFLLKNVSSHL